MNMMPPVEEEEEAEIVEAPPAPMSIPVPPGFKLPMGKKDGDTIEVIAKVKKQGDQLIIESIDGMGEKPPGNPSPDSDDEFAGELSTAING